MTKTLDYPIAGSLILALTATAAVFVVFGSHEVSTGNTVGGGLLYLSGLILIVTVLGLLTAWAKKYDWVAL